MSHLKCPVTEPLAVVVGVVGCPQLHQFVTELFPVPPGRPVAPPATHSSCCSVCPCCGRWTPWSNSSGSTRARTARSTWTNCSLRCCSLRRDSGASGGGRRKQETVGLRSEPGRPCHLQRPVVTRPSASEPRRRRRRLASRASQPENPVQCHVCDGQQRAGGREREREREGVTRPAAPPAPHCFNSSSFPFLRSFSNTLWHYGLFLAKSCFVYSIVVCVLQCCVSVVPQHRPRAFVSCQVGRTHSCPSARVIGLYVRARVCQCAVCVCMWVGEAVSAYDYCLPARMRGWLRARV